MPRFTIQDEHGNTKGFVEAGEPLENFSARPIGAAAFRLPPLELAQG